MIKLGVNIDHVATVRQARQAPYPDILAAANAALRGGADGITIHLREDRRHIQDADVRTLRADLDTHLNLEMALSPDVMAVATSVVPDQVTLVPEKREELTTEGGLDVCTQEAAIAKAVSVLKSAGVACVSAFIEPDQRQIDAAVRAGVDAIEIHTGAYANATSPENREPLIQAIRCAAAYGAAARINVFAGHGLDTSNVGPIVAMPHIEELNIGYAIVARALFVGLTEAVAEMNALLKP